MTRLHRRPAALLAALALVAALVGSVTTMSTSSAFTARVTNSTNTAATPPYFTCIGADTAPAAGSTFFVYPLSDRNTPDVLDVSGNSGRTGTFNGTSTTATGAPGSIFRGVEPGPCPRDPVQANSLKNSSIRFAGSNNDGYISGPNVTQNNPTTFTVEVWFNTATRSGGRLIGFGNKRNGTTASNAASTNYDRHIYMNNSGQLYFGVYPDKPVTVNTTTSYNDSQWHLVTATLSTAGMRLYVDGELAASNSNTAAQSYSGFWRIGWDSLNTWPNRPSTDYFDGSLAYAAVYTIALTASQVRGHYLAGG